MRIDIANKMLLNATVVGNIEQVDSALSSGANINVKNSDGMTPLMLACFNGNRELAEFLLEKGAKVDVKDSDGWNALMWATRHDNIELIDCLVRHGANVNYHDGDGWNALFHACTKGNLKVVKYLVEHGAVIDSKNSLSKTVFEYATTDEIKNYLFEKIEKDKMISLFKKSLVQKEFDNALLMLQNGMDINYRNENDDTLLIEMIREGNKKAVQFLVDNGADLQLPDANGQSPLQICKQSKNEEIALIIYEKGVEKEKEKEKKKTRYISQDRVK